MQNILFRGLCVDGKTHYGGVTPDKKFIISSGNENAENFFFFRIQKGYEPEMWTGLTDGLGVKIFERDTVEDGDETAQVVFDDDLNGFALYYDDGSGNVDIIGIADYCGKELLVVNRDV